MTMRRLLAIALLALPTAAFVRGQEPPPAPAPASPAATAAPSQKNPWQYSLTVSGYLIEGEDGYVQPVLMANRKWLHLEARYNYENFRTGSLWMGYNFSWGKTWQFEVTPMIGGVFGRTNGIAPGCEASLTWKKLNFSISNEYVFDTTSKSGNFYYNWPQITYQLNSWLNFGGVAQRTKTFQTKLDVQRGFFVGLQHKELSFTTYVFNPGTSSTSVVLEAGWSF